MFLEPLVLWNLLNNRDLLFYLDEKTVKVMVTRTHHSHSKLFEPIPRRLIISNVSFLSNEFATMIAQLLFFFLRPSFRSDNTMFCISFLFSHYNGKPNIHTSCVETLPFVGFLIFYQEPKLLLEVSRSTNHAFLDVWCSTLWDIFKSYLEIYLSALLGAIR